MLPPVTFWKKFIGASFSGEAATHFFMGQFVYGLKKLVVFGKIAR